MNELPCSDLSVDEFAVLFSKAKSERDRKKIAKKYCVPFEDTDVFDEAAECNDIERLKYGVFRNNEGTVLCLPDYRDGVCSLILLSKPVYLVEKKDVKSLKVDTVVEVDIPHGDISADVVLKLFMNAKTERERVALARKYCIGFKKAGIVEPECAGFKLYGFYKGKRAQKVAVIAFDREKSEVCTLVPEWFDEEELYLRQMKTGHRVAIK